MKEHINRLTGMVQKDAIVAGYGIVAGTLRRIGSKLLGSKGVGEHGVNAASFAAGTGLSFAPNKHLQVVGSALRIGSFASFGNNVISNLLGINKRKPEEVKNSDNNSESTDSK